MTAPFAASRRLLVLLTAPYLRISALLAFVEKRRDCGSQCAAVLEKAAPGLADRCSKKAAPESLELLGTLLEAYADVRCKAEPLQNALVDAEAVQRLLSAPEACSKNACARSDRR